MPEVPEKVLPGLGDLVTVDNLDLSVLSVESYNTTLHDMFNEENTRVQVRVGKHKDEKYDFASHKKFIIIDHEGAGHGADWYCMECPDNLYDLTLYGNQPVERYVYFTLPNGAIPAFLRYETGFIFTHEAVIALQ